VRFRAASELESKGKEIVVKQALALLGKLHLMIFSLLDLEFAVSSSYSDFEKRPIHT
jgi:hypothetical protein